MFVKSYWSILYVRKMCFYSVKELCIFGKNLDCYSDICKYWMGKIVWTRHDMLTVPHVHPWSDRHHDRKSAPFNQCMVHFFWLCSMGGTSSIALVYLTASVRFWPETLQEQACYIRTAHSKMVLPGTYST